VDGSEETCGATANDGDFFDVLCFLQRYYSMADIYQHVIQRIGGTTNRRIFAGVQDVNSFSSSQPYSYWEETGLAGIALTKKRLFKKIPRHDPRDSIVHSDN